MITVPTNPKKSYDIDGCIASRDYFKLERKQNKTNERMAVLDNVVVFYRLFCCIQLSFPRNHSSSMHDFSETAKAFSVELGKEYF